MQTSRIILFALLALAIVAAAAGAEIALYVDGQPTNHGQGFAFGATTTLSVYSDSAAAWSGRIETSAFLFQDPRLGGEVLDGGYSPATSPGTAYDLHVASATAAGEHFLAEMHFDEAGQTLVTLWDSARPLPVPADYLTLYAGGPIGIEMAEVTADADEPYVLGPGETVTLDASASTVKYWWEPWTGQEPSESPVPADRLFFWRINGMDVAFGRTVELGFEPLTDALGSTEGTYELELLVCDQPGSECGTATTGITVPEPASAAGVLIGLLLLGRRRRRGAARAREASH